MNVIDELIAQLEMNYYSRLILLIIEISALVVGVFKFKSLGHLRVFLLYILFDMTLFITSIVIDTLKSLPVPQIHTLNETINLTVSISEIAVYFIYFKKEIRNYNVVKPTFTILLLALLYSSYKLSFTSTAAIITFQNISYFFSSVSFLLILPLAFISILDLLKSKTASNIYILPRFWITIGILYYSAISIPFYFFRGFFDMGRDMKVLLDTVLFYTPFSLNLLCILTAFLCKKQVKN